MLYICSISVVKFNLFEHDICKIDEVNQII